jgi:hypothetical protein
VKILSSSLSTSIRDGIDFLGTQTGFSKGSFIAMDAVKWIVENVKGVGTRKQAVKILRVSRNSILTE